MPSRAVAVILVLVVAVGAAYFAFAPVQKRFQQRQVRELVADTSDKLRQVLVAKAVPDLVAPLDANLKRLHAPRDPKLAGAAEEYIVSAREIARRRVEIGSLERRAAASRQALAAHLAGAARRGPGWMEAAIALKKRVDADHFNLRVTLKALEHLLATLPEAERSLAPLVGADLLIDENLRFAAHKQVQDQIRRAADDHERAQRLR